MLKYCCTLVWLLAVLAAPAPAVTEDVPSEPAPAEVPAEAPVPDETPAEPSADLPAASKAQAETPADASAAKADTAESKPTSNSAPAAPADDRKYDLIYKFAPGEEVRTEIVHKAAVQTTIDGSTQKAETQSKSIKVWRVADVSPEGTVKFLHMVESIDMWQRTQGRQEVRYNSLTDTEAPPGYEEVAAAVGKPLTVVTMNPRGKILKREEKRAHPIGASTQMTIPLPEQPVSVGETWNYPVDIDVTLSEGGIKKIHTRQKFTLEKVSDGLATIQVESQVLTPIHDPAIEAQLIQRMSSGTVRFDLEKGRVVSQQLDLDRHVIGFSGAASSMHYVTRFTEELLPETAKTAKKPPAAAQAAPKKAQAKAAAADPASKAAPKSAAPKTASQKAAPPKSMPATGTPSAKPNPARQATTKPQKAPSR